MGQEQVGPGERGQPSSHDTGTSAWQVALAVQFSELARSLQQQVDPEAPNSSWPVASSPRTGSGAPAILQRRVKALRWMSMGTTQG